MSRKPTFLFVDDEMHILSSLKRSLRKEGWNLLTATSPQEALVVLFEADVDVLVSDQKMPGGSGLELLTQARERLPQIRCVLLTGWPEMLSKAEVAAVGIDAILPKPWEDAQLKELLRGLVRD